jgi:hypothetical protein
MMSKRLCPETWNQRAPFRPQKLRLLSAALIFCQPPRSSIFLIREIIQNSLFSMLHMNGASLLWAVNDQCVELDTTPNLNVYPGISFVAQLFGITVMLRLLLYLRIPNKSHQDDRKQRASSNHSDMWSEYSRSGQNRFSEGLGSLISCLFPGGRISPMCFRFRKFLSNSYTGNFIFEPESFPIINPNVYPELSLVSWLSESIFMLDLLSCSRIPRNNSHHCGMHERPSGPSVWKDDCAHRHSIGRLNSSWNNDRRIGVIVSVSEVT